MVAILSVLYATLLRIHAVLCFFSPSSYFLPKHWCLHVGVVGIVAFVVVVVVFVVVVVAAAVVVAVAVVAIAVVVVTVAEIVVVL